MTNINAEQFAQMIRSESLLETVSLILVNSSDTMINMNNVNHYYISTIIAPEEKRTLFNAIHAAQSVHSTDANIVTMADYYGKHSGARVLNILVAEDNLVNQQVINGILKHAGHIVNITNNGEVVLDILSADISKVDMLIVDMNMPGLSGLDVVKAVRFIDTSHSLPIIVLTADATPEAKTNSMNAGASAFLTKPINSRTLLEKIAVLSQQVGDKKSTAAESLPAESSLQTAIEEPSEPSWFNESALDELAKLGDGPEFIQSLVRNYIDDSKKHVVRIRESARDDYLEYREALHALKGSSTELGASKLVQICLEGEELKPYDLDTDKIYQLSNEIESVYQKTIKALSTAVEIDIDDVS